MKISQTLLIIFISFGVAFVTARYGVPNQFNQSKSEKESAYDRVIRTGTLRCGYVVFAPYFMKDSATGAYSGIWHDFTEDVAEHLGLKVDWAEEVGMGDIPTALNSNRIDAYCSSSWTPGKRVRAMNFLRPTAYESMLVYVRKNDHRFDDDVNKINDTHVRVSTIDGESGGLIAGEDFPKAQIVSLPQLSSYPDMFNQVITNKADVLFATPSGVAAFMKNNPDVLRPILSHPIRIYPDTWGAVRYGEDSLREMLNQAEEDVIYNGVMDKILSKYEINKGDFWRVAKPYTPPQ